MENSKNNNTKTPAVSVVMACYNSQRFLVLALESILKQNFFDFEFLIVNDASIDQSPQILRQYATKDQRLKIITNSENLGLTKSLNKALALAKGKYIARMDDDDISLPSRFQKQFQFMEQNKDVALCGTMGFIINEKGERVGQKNLAVSPRAIKKKLLFNNQLLHSSWFLRRAILDEVGFYDESFKKAQDYEFILRLAQNHKIENLPEHLIEWRRRPGSLSFADKKQQKYALKARWLAIAKYGYPKAKGLFHIIIRALRLLA